MLTVVRNAQGHLVAACDWWLVDAAGYWQPQTGQYVFVHQLELTPGMTPRHVWAVLVKAISLDAPGALGAFWHREHDAFPRPHGFRRAQFRQLREEVRV